MLVSGNFFAENEERNFWVWIDPKDDFIRHSVGLIGSFTSANIQSGSENLIFMPNPKFATFISPFQNNLMRNYMVEYNLEMHRRHSFTSYPSRLEAVYLLDSENAATVYRTNNEAHVEGRILKRAKTVGSYIFSKHDSSWINFMRLNHSMDEQTIFDVCRAYWAGETVAGTTLISKGKPWHQAPSYEILFLGRIDFPDKSLV